MYAFHLLLPGERKNIGFDFFEFIADLRIVFFRNQRAGMFHEHRRVFPVPMVGFNPYLQGVFVQMEQRKPGKDMVFTPLIIGA